jgi:hypothetical protein
MMNREADGNCLVGGGRVVLQRGFGVQMLMLFGVGSKLIGLG